jgi:hypothetical protein
VPGEEGLAEGLGTLELCCAGAGTEAAQALRFEVIDHACHERRFRAHDRQADVLAAHEIRERVEIHRVDGHVLHARIEGRAGIARGDVDAADARLSPRPSRPKRVPGHRCRVPGPSSARCPAQWRKCRMPVKTMAMPASSAAAITSSSRIDPPGWMTARCPW